ncbi:SigE family RNA polymerase sigma factor [Virgisporangium ochraceum]|nr:SigE family RNA polymerase sigma factor [Virgisporangium ochraceum]
MSIGHYRGGGGMLDMAIPDEEARDSDDAPPTSVRVPSVPPVPAASTADFDAFYLANFDRFIVQLHAYTADMATAQDVVQEAFARALQRWSRVSTYDNPEAWVRRVAWNLATSNWRRIARFNTFMRKQSVERLVAEPSPDRVMLVRALATLPETQRRAVVLHYLGDMSVNDIAAQERVAPGTVKSWLHRGRAALAAALSDSKEEAPGREVHDG